MLWTRASALRRKWLGRRALAMVCGATGGARLAAQAPRTVPDEPWLDATTGGEAERYLRALQIAGLAPVQTRSIRLYGEAARQDVRARAMTGPWHAVVRTSDDGRGRVAFGAVQPSVASIYNSAFPFSMNDGAVWAGRGATLVARGGVHARYGVLSLRLEPVAFVTQNRGFALMPNGVPTASPFADPLEPTAVDQPQRFGDGAYGRVDPGQSTIRLDAFGLMVAASTANEVWGPALVDPLVLGDNAAGIPRIILGTSRPVSWGLGEVHVRLEAGELHQSAYSPMPADSARRTMAGIVGMLTIRALPGLEVGAGRFYHRAQSAADPRFSLGAFRIPFEAVFKDQLPGKDASAPDNQLASVFARWAVPSARLEVYGEYGRNDHNQDLRDLIVEPDHDAAYTLGVQRVWAPTNGRLIALRAETMNARITHLQRVRGQARWDQHDAVRQGHTQWGELLGSAAGLGGAATTVGVDVYTPQGRWTFEAARRVRQQALGESSPADSIDVYSLLRAERLWFTRRGDVTLGVSAIGELNRDFVGDAYGLRLEAGWRRR